MLFSIVVPCFNLARYLPDALGSVLAQTYDHWECLVVNDGSPDDTEDVAREWTARDARFKLLNKSNGGVSSAINYGLQRSTGDYLLILSADDIIYEEYLAKARQKLAKAKAEMLLCGYYFFETVGSTKGGEPTIGVTRANFLKRLSREVIAPPHCHVIARTLFEKVGYFDETLPSAEDWDLWARMGRVVTSLATLDYRGGGYRMRPGSLSRNAKVMLETSVEVARRIRRPDPRLPADQRISVEPIEPVIIHYLMRHCGDLLFAGKPQEAAAMFEWAVREYGVSPEPPDCADLISYLQFQEVPAPDARRRFWSTHVSAISEFLLSCEGALQKKGFYSAAMTYLTAVWLQPEDMVGIIPFIRTKQLLRGAVKTIAAKLLLKLQVSFGLLHAKTQH